ncbi:MAG: endonuclease III domain-containing protein [Phycisphaerae bacterium]
MQTYPVDCEDNILNNAGMSMTGQKLKEIYDLLFERFGCQRWWPGETKDEIVAGAILTQNTNWQNVEKALNNLKNAKLMTLEKLHGLDHDTLARLIRPAGYYNIKAKRLKNFLNWFFEQRAGSFDALEKLSTAAFREELLGINGIGRETADSILLYAFERPVFVVDAYTYRIAVRHQLIEPECDYEQLRSLFEDNLENDVKLFNEFHALIVRAGKEFCRPQAKCEGCPIESLPHRIDG